MVLARGEYTIAELHDGVPEKFFRAWANSIDGSVDFSKTSGDNRSFLGTHTGLVEPTHYSQYLWSKFKGENGSDGISIVSVQSEFAVNASKTTAPTSGWVSTQPVRNEGQYLWRRDAIKYSDNSTTYTNGVMVTGDKGDTGLTGDSGLSIMLLNESQPISTTSARVVAPAQTISIPFTAYLGSSQIACTASVGVLPSGITVTSNTAGTATENGLIVLTVANGANLGGATTDFDTGKIDISITASGRTVVKPFSYSKSVAGANGATARTFFVDPDVSVIKRNKDGSYTPSSLLFSSSYKDGTNASKVAYTRYWRIETTLDGVTWTELARQTTLSATYNVTSIPAGIVGIRATTYSSTALTVATAHDTQSVMIVSDGVDGNKGDKGDDAYTVLLSNESHAFAGDETKAIASSTQVDVIAYKGSTKVASSIGTITGQVAGVTTSIAGNGTLNNTFTVNASTALIARNGVLVIPITVDGTTFTKSFSFSLALKGAVGTKGDSGVNAQLINLSASSQIFTNPKVGAVTPTTITVTGTAQNTTIATWQYSVNGGSFTTTLPAGVTRSGNTVTLTGTTVTARTIAVKALNGSVEDIITIAKVEDGVDGASGIGITSVDVEYYLSTSSTTQTGGVWSTTAPTWVNGRFMWSRTKTTYTVGDPTTSNPVCITGGAGATGGTGRGVTSITEEYAMSTSKTVAPTVFSTTTPTWSVGQYMWTRSRIVYSNPTATEYTTPYVDTSWEAVNGLRADVESSIGTINTSVTTLQSTTLPALEDSLLNKSEKEAVRQSLNIVRNDKGELDSQYTVVYANSSLIGTPKTNLFNAKVAFNTAFTNLESGINTVLGVADGTRITPAQFTNVQTRFTQYTSALVTLRQRFEEAMDAISGKKVDDVDLESDKKTYLPVRYIRDWANGSSANTSNHWVQIEAYSKGTNVARGKTVTTSATTTTNISRVTDGNTSSSTYFSGGSGLAHIQVDLGQIFYNIDNVKVWHFHSDSRTYRDTKTEVSPDGVTWYAVFDSYNEGEYPESSQGRTSPNTYAKHESLTATASRIRQLASEIDLSVKSGDLINSINVSKEGIKIKGNKIEVDGDTTFKDDVVMDGGVIRSKSGGTRLDLNTNTFVFDKPFTIGSSSVGTLEHITTAETSAKNHANTIVAPIKTTADTALANAGTANTAIGDIMSDLKITPVEKAELSRLWERIKAEYSQLSVQATALGVSSTAYVSAYNALNSTAPRIQTDILASMTATYTLTTATRDTFKSQMNTYFVQAETLSKAISDKIQSNASGAQTSANTANKSISDNKSKWDTASTDATNAKNAVADMSTDDKLTPVEKQQLKKEWATISAEKTSYEALATTYAITTEKTNYVNAYNTLNTLLNTATTGYLVNLTTTLDLGTGGGASFRAKFDDYYDKKALLIKKVNETARTLANTADATANTVKGIVSTFDNSIINTNPIFLDWTGTNPAGYSSTAVTGMTKVTSGNGMGNAVRYVVSAGVNCYLSPNIVTNVPYFEYVTVEATFMLQSGTIDGSGVLLRYNATANEDHRIHFKDIVSSPVLNKWYTVTKVVKQASSPSGFTGYSVYPMGGWTSFGTVTAKTIQFDSVKARPSTEQEIISYEDRIVITDMATDGKITPIEKQQLKKEWATIFSEKASLDGSADVFAITTEKTNLNTAYNTLNTVLNNSSTGILANMSTTSTVVASTFRAQFDDYYDKKAVLMKRINELAKSRADGAQSTANTANSTANTAKSTADTALANAGTANSAIADIMSDLKITPVEKAELSRNWERIKAEYSQLNAQASSLGVSSTTRTNYTNAYNALNSTAPRIQTDILANMTTVYTLTTATRDTFKTQMNTYFTQAEAISKAITDKIQDNASSADTKAGNAHTRAENAELNAIKYTNETTGNLIDNHTSGKVVGTGLGRWSGSGLTVVDQEFQGAIVPVLQSTHSSSVTNQSGWFDVDTSKAYEVSVWVKKSSGNGYIYVGLSTQNSAGATTSITAVNKSGTVSSTTSTNFYFYRNSTTSNSPTEWTKIVGYIMPVGTDASDIAQVGIHPTAVNAPMNAIFNPEVRQVRVRILNNNNTQSNQLWIANPKVQEVDPLSVVNSQKAIISAGSAQSTADTALSNANSANSAIGDIMSDLKITPVEKAELARTWERIKAEYSQLSTQATALSVSTTNYTNAYNALNSTAPRIQTDILANMTTNYTLTTTTRDTFKAQLNTYFAQAEAISKAITDKIQSNASLAQGTANTAVANASSAQSTANTAVSNASSAQSTADSALSNANSANSAIGDIMSDLKITPVEKAELSRLWERIKAEYTQLNSQASSVGVASATRTNYTNAYNALNSTAPRIQTDILANMSTNYTLTTTTRDTFKTQMNTYFVQSETISKAITDKIQSNATDAQGRVGSVEGKINNAVTTIDGTGVTVKDGSFFLEDDVSKRKYSIVSKENLVRDHSFELVGLEYQDSHSLRTDSHGNYYMLSSVNELFNWNTVGAPRVLSSLSNGTIMSSGMFGSNAVHVNNTNYVYQNLPLPPETSGFYTASVFAKRSFLSTTGTSTPQIIASLSLDGITYNSMNGNTGITVSQGDSMIRTSLRIDLSWLRQGFTSTQLERAFLRVSINSGTTNWVLIDGVQVVKGEHPTHYSPEDSLFQFMNGVNGSSARELYAGALSVDGRSAGINGDLYVYGSTNLDRIEFPRSKYFSNSAYAMNLNNSDMVNVNNIYFADETNSEGEGIMFPKDGITGSTNSDDYHTLRGYRGLLYFDGSPIINNGSNSNGNWIRYGDGTQICWNHNFSVTASTSNVAGSVFRSGNLSWTYPMAFTANVSLFGTPNSWTTWATTNGRSLTVGTLVQWSYQNRAVNDMSVMAIGRWK